MNIIENNTERRLYHYAVYMHSDVMADKVQRAYPLIVLKNEYGVIGYFTSLHKYVRSYSHLLQSLMMKMDGQNRISVNRLDQW